MSILDAISPDVVQTADKLLGPIIEAAMEGFDLSEKQRKVLESVKTGAPLAAALSLSPQHLDALLLRGYDLLKLGRIDAAHDLLTLVVALFPFDPRALYALGLANQIAGEIEAAAKLFLMFVARDATDPEGHLRLGECLMSAREYDKAEECFVLASRLCARGYGSASAQEHAARMTAYLALLLKETAQ